MPTATYLSRRGQIETYFDRTAVDAWSRLTSDAPVGRIRATVRAGRDRMRHVLLSWLPPDLSGRRVLDAGCGTGAFAVEAARRGAHVVAIDLSPRLVALARDRTPQEIRRGTVEFHVGDMFDAALGRFDHIVAMDSLIHYRTSDVVPVLAGFAQRARESLLFTFAPRTPLLSVMHAVGRVLPRGYRAPAIEPVAAHDLERRIVAQADLSEFSVGRTERVASGFYTSQAMELARR